MRSDWQALAVELDHWAAAGARATFWWRDDDATGVSPALQTLHALASRFALRPALAVIPRDLQPVLGEWLQAHGDVDVLQHGYAHLNHAPATEKKCELGAHRPVDVVIGELAEGRRRLQARLPRAPSVLVPPWNRIDPRVVAALPGIGLGALSAFTPRQLRRDAAGVVHANTHVDPVHWHGGCGYLGEAGCLAQVLEHLRARRAGDCDAREATGLLTHHLVQDAATWRFCERLFEVTLAHPAGSWLSAGEVFAD